MRIWTCPSCGRQTERDVQDWCACTKMGTPTKMHSDSKNLERVIELERRPPSG